MARVALAVPRTRHDRGTIRVTSEHAAPVPTASVVIATHNRAKSLLDMLGVVLAEPGAFEVVVIDDASDDDTWERLLALAERDVRVQPIRVQKMGQRAATRVGVERSRGRVLVFLDDDVLPEPGIVARHLRRHEARDDLIVLGYMPTDVPGRWHPGSFATWLYAESYRRRCEAYQRDPQAILQHLWMGNVSMPRSAYLHALEVAPPDFPYRGDDREIGLLCAVAGMTAEFDPTIRARHTYVRSLAQFVLDCRSEGAGAATLASRYPDLVDPIGPWRTSGSRGLARLVMMSVRNRTIHGLASAAVQRLVMLGGRIRLRSVELTSARVLRRLEQHYGAETWMAGHVP